MWIAVKDECAYMLASDVYDAFVLVPLYIGMYYKEDIHIHGCVSKRLYKNVMNYIQRILCDFSDDLSRINVTVDGLKTADGNPEIIGAGLSCGVDSLLTVYDWYVNETDPDYRINALFFFNTGWHGNYYHPGTKKLCLDRYNLNKHAADELGLPFYLIDSNFHAFTHKIYGRSGVSHIGYIANYSCVLGLQRAVKKYYVASGRSYEKIKQFSQIEEHNVDLSGFAESYLIPLIQTEKVELVIDGCQYDRTEKTERISDWDIAHKYLNPCDLTAERIGSPYNCSKCGKCLRTLIAIEALGKLDAFAGVFDLAVYKKYAYRNKIEVVALRNKQAQVNDNYNFAVKQGLKMPPKLVASIYYLSAHPMSCLKNTARRVLGKKTLRCHQENRKAAGCGNSLIELKLAS